MRHLTPLLCVLALAGCGLPGGDDAREPGVGGGHAAADDAGARTLPIQAYLLTAEQRSTVHRAAQRIVRTCMEAEGFEIGLPDLAQSASAQEPDDFLDRRYAAVYDERTARQYGLHVPLFVESPRPPAEPSLDAAATAALFGSVEESQGREDVDVSKGRLSYGGCLGEAEAQLAEGTSYVVAIGAAPAEPVRQLNLDSTAAELPRVKDAQASWSACMAEGGYRLATTVADVESVPGVDVAAPRPSQAEIALAVWNVKCQQRTHVVDIWFEAESAYQAEQIDEKAEVFAEVRRENELLLERAAQVLGEDAP